MFAALALFTSLASATEPSADLAPDVGSARVYDTLPGSVAVPTDHEGIAQSYSVEAGALFLSHNQLGIRLAYVPYPHVHGGAASNHAVGPALVWAYQARTPPPGGPHPDPRGRRRVRPVGDLGREPRPPVPPGRPRAAREDPDRQGGVGLGYAGLHGPS